MNGQISKLYHISTKSSRLVIGLMSGTSLDGLDIALCHIQNQGIDTVLKVLQFTTKPYTQAFRSQIRQVFAKREIDQQVLCGLNAYIGIQHAALILEALKDWGIDARDIDLIASHGQTVFHAPQILTNDTTYPNSTLQIGDGDHIAHHTGIITISDFRQKHIAAGGEGAPLAAYGDFLLFTHDIENRILLNIGGISNFTFLPSSGSALKAFATDLGPGNTIMDQYMLKYFGKEMDEDGLIARSGKVNQALLMALLKEPFLALEFPKTTGPELFNLAYLDKIKNTITGGKDIGHQDILATLNSFSAQAIINGIREVSSGLSNVAVYMSGGGIHNPILVDNIQKELSPVKIESIDSLGMNPDAKEACLFALLANETISGNPNNVNNIKESPAVCMGKISLPY